MKVNKEVLKSLAICLTAKTMTVKGRFSTEKEKIFSISIEDAGDEPNVTVI